MNTTEENTAPVSEATEETPPPETETATIEPTAEEKYAVLQDQYLRLAADFENYRKRQQQEVDALRKYAVENALHAIIPVFDNLDRAAQSLTEQSDPKLLFQSFKLMQNQLMEAFGSVGLQKMKTVGEAFNPAFHEAISQVASDVHPEDTVVQEMQPGYLLHDRVIRPAMVTVSSGKGDTGATPAPPAENPFSQSNPE